VNKVHKEKEDALQQKKKKKPKMNFLKPLLIINPGNQQA
jgi:hypothetical protein